MSGKMIVAYTDINGNRFEIKNVAQVDFSFLGNIDDGFGKNEDWNFVQVITKQNDKLEKLVIKNSNIMQFFINEIKE
jgi:hypothetical protein